MARKYFYHALPPRMREFLDRRWYTYVSRLDQEGLVLLMNHGYACLDPDAAEIEMSPDDDRHRYPLQLYHHLASAVDLNGVDVLEIGSGRGGGASYVKRRFGPDQLIGMDIVAKAVDFCCQYYDVDGLSFAQGDAQILPFADESFDAVINVESSGHYANVIRFYDEVVRILRPGGHLLYADVRYWEDLDVWKEQVRNTGLEILKEEDITPNVVRSLTLDGERRQRLIRQHAPKIPLFRKVFDKFSGVDNAAFLQVEPEPGKRVYMHYVLRKPSAPQHDWQGRT